MAVNTMKHLERFSLALQDVESKGQFPPPDGSFTQLHFRASEAPGMIEVFVAGKWYETAAITMLNGLFTICPLGVDHPTATPPRPPLRPVPGGR